MVCASHFSPSQYVIGKVPSKLNQHSFPDQHLGTLCDNHDGPSKCNDDHLHLNARMQSYMLKDEICALKISNAAQEKKCTELNRQNKELRQQLQNMKAREEAFQKNQLALDSDTKVSNIQKNNYYLRV